MERIIRTVKDAIHQGRSQWLYTFWSDHVGPALMLLCFTIAQATHIDPFAMATGHDTLLPSIVVPPLPLPEKPSAREERPYQEALFGQVLRLQELGGTQLHESKWRICTLTRHHEDKREMPTLLSTSNLVSLSLSTTGASPRLMPGYTDHSVFKE